MSANASHLLWYLSRGSGLVLLMLTSAVVVLGVAVRLGARPRNWPHYAVGEVHRSLALFSIVLLALHVATALADPYVSIGWAASLVPFSSPYRPFWLGLGTLAVDLGAAVLLTSILRHRLGFSAWKRVHWLAYLAWPAAVVHSLGAGNDLRIGWVAGTICACAMAVAVAGGARLFSWAQHGEPAPGAGGGLPAAALPRSAR